MYSRLQLQYDDVMTLMIHGSFRLSLFRPLSRRRVSKHLPVLSSLLSSKTRSVVFDMVLTCSKHRRASSAWRFDPLFPSVPMLNISSRGKWRVRWRGQIKRQSRYILASVGTKTWCVGLVVSSEDPVSHLVQAGVDRNLFFFFLLFLKSIQKCPSATPNWEPQSHK